MKNAVGNPSASMHLNQSGGACSITDAECQTDEMFTSEACNAVVDVLERHLGYSDTPLSLPELWGKAKYLLENNWRLQDVESIASRHNGSLDSIRKGDSLQRLDGSSWKLWGYDGSSMLTASDTIKVIEYDTQNAVAKVRDNASMPRMRNGEAIFGKVELPNYMFSTRRQLVIIIVFRLLIFLA